MRTRAVAIDVVLSLGLLVASAAAAVCPADAVQSGTVCMDKYEASVWLVPSSEKSLINMIQKGLATRADLTSGKAVAAGVVQLGLVSGDLAAAGCPDTGNGCVNVYAVSIPGVLPAASITWLQAAAAARNSLKRLATNQEWQVGALGTPDPGTADDGATTCNTTGPGPSPTGSRSACVSDVGAFDMVGNVWEFVAEWGDLANGCGSWSATYGNDLSCFGGPGAGFTNLPGVLLRGGTAGSGAGAGVFAVAMTLFPSLSDATVGFRCVH